jgi:hypothetical protein
MGARSELSPKPETLSKSITTPNPMKPNQKNMKPYKIVKTRNLYTLKKNLHPNILKKKTLKKS